MMKGNRSGLALYTAGMLVGVLVVIVVLFGGAGVDAALVPKCTDNTCCDKFGDNFKGCKAAGCSVCGGENVICAFSGDGGSCCGGQNPHTCTKDEMCCWGYHYSHCAPTVGNKCCPGNQNGGHCPTDGVCCNDGTNGFHTWCCQPGQACGVSKGCANSDGTLGRPTNLRFNGELMNEG